MKIGHVLLIGGGLAALAYRKKIAGYATEKTEDIKEEAAKYVSNKVNISPKGLPRISVDLKRGAIKLKGSLELSNRLPYGATLNTYQINLDLVKGSKRLNIGRTPIAYPNIEIKGNSKTSVDYEFKIKLDTLSELITNKEYVSKTNLYLTVDHLKMNGITVPSIKFDISNTWQEITSAIKNPASLITSLFK